MRVPYFMDRLANLTNFDGWVPRWYIPSAELKFTNSNRTAFATVMIIDTAHEIKVGMGHDWTPIVLGRD